MRAFDIDPQSGLYPDERQIVDLLVEAWNTFMKRADQSWTQEEIQRFRHAIHEAQQIFADRALQRAYPEFWN